MVRKKDQWQPCCGTVAVYSGRQKKLTRNVRVVAEATAGRMVVEAIGRKGIPVMFTVKRENLKPLQPGLFD